MSAVEFQCDSGFLAGFGMATGKFEELGQRPVGLKPVGGIIDRAAEAVFYAGAIVPQGGDGGKVVPGILAVAVSVL